MFYRQDLGSETDENEYKQPVSHTLLSKENAIKIIKKRKPLSNKFYLKK